MNPTTIEIGVHLYLVLPSSHCKADSSVLKNAEFFPLIVLKNVAKNEVIIGFVATIAKFPTFLSLMNNDPIAVAPGVITPPSSG